MKFNSDSNLNRAKSLGEILVSATPFLLEGYATAPGSAFYRRQKSLGTQIKSSAKDLVTVFDKKVESYLLEQFSKVFKNEIVLGEETVSQKNLKSHLFLKEYESEKGIWIFDPIDGTTNYSKAYPFFCVTAAYIYYSKKNSQWKAKVCATWNPLTRELFWAAENCGAWLNRTRMRVSQTSDSVDSLWITGFASERSTDGQRPFDLFTKITKKTLGVRRDGSAALDLAYVASGRVEGFWEWGLAPWDIAAGILLVEEAGGKVTDLSGKKVDINCGEIVATNSRLHKWLLDSIKD
jgi:myo-inositol-1(or 4)-monophosphatase